MIELFLACNVPAEFSGFLVSLLIKLLRVAYQPLGWKSFRDPLERHLFTRPLKGTSACRDADDEDDLISSLTSAECVEPCLGSIENRQQFDLFPISAPHRIPSWKRGAVAVSLAPGLHGHWSSRPDVASDLSNSPRHRDLLHRPNPLFTLSVCAFPKLQPSTHEHMRT